MDKNFFKFLSQVGERIKKARLEAGLTQKAVAMKGIDVRYIRRIERGHNITLWTIYRLSRKIGVPVTEFFSP